MERFYRVMAQSAEWYARNICRTPGSDAGFKKLATEYRRKQANEQQRVGAPLR